MENSIKRPLVVLFFALIGLGPLVLYLTSGLSFYTFHALSGLMPIKHQIALSFLKGEYPLWNPFMLCGAPFHSGIGIFDPFLISYVFLKGIPALMASTYLALCFAGLSMYLYLHKSWKFSIEASLLGGMLYLLNPFFAATSHESPFMIPAVYLPTMFWFFEEGVRCRSLWRAMVSGVFLSGAFLSGNLESFYFIGLFFCVAQLVRIFISYSEHKKLKQSGFEFFLLSMAGCSSLAFMAFDLFPSLEMIMNSGRDAQSTASENLGSFIFVGSCAAFLVVLGSSAVKKIPRGILEWGMRVFFIGIFLLFVIQVDWSQTLIHFNTNVFFPQLDLIMVQGQSIFQLLINELAVSKDVLKGFVEPRFIFYIQPPAYLFTLPTLILFIYALVFIPNRNIKALSWIGFLLVVFPFSFIPNINHHLFHWEHIAYPRIMFAFFFIQALVITSAYEALVVTRARGGENPSKLLSICIFGALGGLCFMVWISQQEWEVGAFIRLLEQFNSLLGFENIIQRSKIFGALILKTFAFLVQHHVIVFGFMMVKGCVILLLFLAMMFPKWIWRGLFLLFLALELILSWNFYTFQKDDVSSVSKASPEATFLHSMDAESRVGTMQDKNITLWNFYDRARPLELAANMPLFWGAKTMEGAALNLSPRLFGEFWGMESENHYTPTVMNVSSSLIYDLMGMKYLFTDNVIENDQYDFMLTGNRYHVYANKKAMPRFYFAKKIGVKSDEEMEVVIREGRWDPKEISYLYQNSRDESIDVSEWTYPDQGGVSLVKESYNTVELKVMTEVRTLLVTSDAYHSGWKVWVNGVEKPLYRANYYFKAVELDPGVQTVKFRYHSSSHQWGLIVTAIFGMMLLFCMRFESKFMRGS